MASETFKHWRTRSRVDAKSETSEKTRPWSLFSKMDQWITRSFCSHLTTIYTTWSRIRRRDFWVSRVNWKKMPRVKKTTPCQKPRKLRSNNNNIDWRLSETAHWRNGSKRMDSVVQTNAESLQPLGSNVTDGENRKRTLTIFSVRRLARRPMSYRCIPSCCVSCRLLNLIKMSSCGVPE